MIGSTSYALTDRDVHYLTSINRSVGDVEVGRIGDVVTPGYVDHLRAVLPRIRAASDAIDGGPSLVGEIVADNYDWLDCFIDMMDRRK
ncbi:hypothetical protein D3C71_216460 [compost metagenome]